MSTSRAVLAIPVAVVLLGGCSDGGGSTSSSAPSTTPATTGSAPATPTTTAPASTAAGPDEPTAPPTALDGPVQIDVRVGVDSSPTRIERVRVGANVTLNVSNPDAADEFHVHGIELEQAVAAGVTATFNFVADATGTYEVESHDTGDVLVVIEVI